MQKPSKDDVERLSRGLPTKKKIGSRAVGHRLTQKERILFEAAKRHGVLRLPASGARKNIENIYRLWCEAESRAFVVVQPGS
jgi:hypothetical protein